MTHTNESRKTYEWVTSHAWMGHATQFTPFELYGTYERVMSHMWISHVIHTNESFHTYKWVRWHIWTSHITHMDGSCHTLYPIQALWRARLPPPLMNILQSQLHSHFISSFEYWLIFENFSVLIDEWAPSSIDVNSQKLVIFGELLYPFISLCI